MWRPKDWKNPHRKQPTEEYYEDTQARLKCIDAYEKGADAMLKEISYFLAGVAKAWSSPMEENGNDKDED